MLTVNELFAGIGAFRKALINLGIPHQIVGISEVDKFAIKSYEALYGETRNYGDISKVLKLDYADLWTYGFPCQDISASGAMKGIVEGETRSGLLYEVKRLLGVSRGYNELPKYLIMENVKNLVSKRFKADFDWWISWLDWLGYETTWKVLNASDYGIPQNRERVFAVSIRKDLNQTFEFPQPIPLEHKMADFLEDEVDEKFYINKGYLEWLVKHTEENKEKGLGFAFNPLEREREREHSACIQTRVGQKATISRNTALIANKGRQIVRYTDNGVTLMARDYKGFGHQRMNGVVEIAMQDGGESER